MRLDHVALATRDASGAIAALVGELGGTVLSGGLFTGFRPVQIRLGDAGSGMKVELLEPWAVAENDFLARFLTRHGDGPHHLTFKVDDLKATLERVGGAGYTPVSVDLSEPMWKEAFLLPRDAHGTVVQLAESSDPRTSPSEEYAWAVAHGVDAENQWWPDPPTPAPNVVYLRRVVLSAPALDPAVDFFTGLLDGEAWITGADPRWVEIAWPGGGRIRVEERPDRPAGIDRLELDGGAERHELTVAGTRFVVSPGR